MPPRRQVVNSPRKDFFMRSRAGRIISGRIIGLVLAATMVSVLAVGGTAHAAKAKLSPTTLNAGGATFPLGFYQVAIGEFKLSQKSVTINYTGVGSGTGRTNFSDQVYDFAGTDGLFSASAAAATKGGPFFYFPTVAAPITVAYNLDGVKNLKLSGDTIAKIFQRQITTWDDAAIKADNPGAKLPSTKITVARRSDSSGTTENFTKFLAKAAPSTWTLGSGSTVQWPADTSAGAGNAGVSQVVDTTAGAIGYVDYSDAVAVGLSFAAVKNAEGNFVKPSLKGASAALAGITANSDLSYDPIYASGAKSYPITAPTWIVVYKTQTSKAKGEAVKEFLRFVYGDGQKLAASVDYAALPKGLLKSAKAQIDQIVVPAS
jgi:phosphate transport system substrate-binding protein